MNIGLYEFKITALKINHLHGKIIWINDYFLYMVAHRKGEKVAIVQNYGTNNYPQHVHIVRQ